MAKFNVEYRVSGTLSEIIEAASEEEARKLVEDKAWDENWEPELETVDDVDFYIQQMHRVNRNGSVILTTYPRPGDLPVDDEKEPK